MSTSFSHFATLSTFKIKWLADHANSQDTHFFGNLSNHWTCARACTTTHTSSDKYHVCTLQCISNACLSFNRRRCAHFRFGTSTQTRCTQLNIDACFRTLKCTCICVHANELNTLYTATNHVLHSITACTAHTDHLDNGLTRRFCI